MPQYNAGIVIEGWAKLRITASSRDAVRAKLASPRVILMLVDDNHEPICEVVEPEPILTIVEEEIEVYRPEEEAPYHAPAEQVEEVDLR